MKSLLMATLALAACLTPPALAADPPAPKPQPAAATPASRETVVTMTLWPARPPRPALKYRLLPEFIDRVDENAAPLYLKAFLLLSEAKLTPADLEKVATWGDPRKTPLESLPVAEAQSLLARAGPALGEATLASRRSRCDWAPPIRETANIFALLLPEAQHARNIARLLVLKTRLALRQGKFDEAIAVIRSGYALSRHTAEGPFLINGLVGIAIGTLVNANVEELLQQPAAPNLYWSLVALPNPLIDLRPAYEMESASVQLLFPAVHRALRSPAALSPAEWQGLLHRSVVRFEELASMGPQEANTAGFWKGLATGAFTLTLAPIARQALIDAGRTAREVDAMPPAQVVLTRVFEAYDLYRDELFKLMGLPYWQAAPRLKEVEAELARLSQSGGVLPDIGVVLPRLILPAVGSCRLTQARLERHIAALECLEALRFYAAEHQGALPESLQAVTEVPIPLNAVTGKPFSYRRDGATAILRADGGPANDQTREYRVTIAAPQQ